MVERSTGLQPRFLVNNYGWTLLCKEDYGCCVYYITRLISSILKEAFIHILMVC